MDYVIQNALNAQVVKKTGYTGSGCINVGETYLVDSRRTFIKFNVKPLARLMFEGEFASLKELEATNTIQVPHPIAIFDNPSGGACFAMEHLDMKPLNIYAVKLGEQLAELHLQNVRIVEKAHKESSRVSTRSGDGEPDSDGVEQFGFHTTTCCGYIPLNNTWNSDWTTFFVSQRLEPQLRAVEKEYGDREAIELWSQLQLKIPLFFKDIEIFPSLLHGDLWGGNVGENETGPVMFDPGSFYGHHEFELAISHMFGGFGPDFYKAYHLIIPQQDGFRQRNKIYQLFHYLNHWNHFGSGYRQQCITIMKYFLK